MRAVTTPIAPDRPRRRAAPVSRTTTTSSISGPHQRGQLGRGHGQSSSISQTMRMASVSTPITPPSNVARVNGVQPPLLCPVFG